MFDYTDRFVDRHIGPSNEEIAEMLKSIGSDSVEGLITETIPQEIRLKKDLDLPEAVSEFEFLKQFRQLASNNKVYKSYIGCGYHDTILPNVIKRNVLENPGWYTAYTPYQAEIAQGRLEALINFQTVICDLTGMELANASLLDEGTAAAEAMIMMYNARKGPKKNANKFFLSEYCHPQTIDIIQTRAQPLGIEVVLGAKKDTLRFKDKNLFGDSYFGALLQYPASSGKVFDYSEFIKEAHDNDVLVAVAADIMSLLLLKSPGEMGADVVVGSSQRFGVPMGYGGPHAAFFATREKYKRQIPGRIIGVSKDKEGNTAYRMALQTREQHIKRERATSNICTAQVLLAVISGMYAVYHGPNGLRKIAERIHGMANLLDQQLQGIGYEQTNEVYFDTIKIKVTDIELVKSYAENAGVNFRYHTNSVSIALSESSSKEDVENIILIFEKAAAEINRMELEDEEMQEVIPDFLKRNTDYLSDPVFNSYYSEHDMLRYIKSLENKDVSLTHSMIALGSCTMKLNGTTEMIPVTWDEFANIHPFVPREQALGYRQLFRELNKWLCEITGFARVSLQPNSGAQGEYAGLLTIKRYHKHRGEGHRNIVLIPSSAHGTNPASAVMAGFKVVVTGCDEHGNIDMADLKEKVQQHGDALAGLMITYPSTHGVFEEAIIEICDLIHEYGGQVYMDGANMNAQVGLTSPANIGADVCHLNLHKTFCIPHGGGGPGVGPIGVAAHLKEFLPGHTIIPVREQEEGAVASAPWGSASILPIPYTYMKLMGGDGLRKATEIAILNANYMMVRLKNHYPILYTGSNNRCAHEMIIDCRAFKSIGVDVEDIAKRLMDYGFHAPTVSFPVPGTMMVEPTESESKRELDRFCDAMIAIKTEIEEVAEGISDVENNVLKNAPHTLNSLVSTDWDRPYSREKAAYPLPYLKEAKVWPSVARIDSAYGDRNLICTCPSLEEYES